MTKKNDLQRLSVLTAQAAQMAALGSAEGLRHLFTEMNALNTLMPGLPAMPDGDEDHHLRSDEEVEADFDNMPV